MKIIILNGKGACGKDTFIDLLRKYCKVFHYSSIDTIKSIAMEHFGWDGVKDQKGRKLLSDLKIASINYNDKPHKELKQAITYIRDIIQCDLMVVVIRDIPEIEKVLSDPDLKNYDIRTVLMRRDFSVNKLGNVADDNVDKFDYDYYILNTSTINALEEKALSLLHALGIKRRDK